MMIIGACITASVLYLSDLVWSVRSQVYADAPSGIFPTKVQQPCMSPYLNSSGVSIPDLFCWWGAVRHIDMRVMLVQVPLIGLYMGGAVAVKFLEKPTETA